ncbi:hypothetical protein IV203_016626 [Nitzschia inconspicua]|uniref:Uncharacterized protein n=1 Tax=Nitzschia inconspicua TaxID=303405 RepID=A0A9K3PIE1_9STRA|nr:hypothetical protein IV203_016626 [Nitzschia inconspicua]
MNSSQSGSMPTDFVSSSTHSSSARRRRSDLEQNPSWTPSSSSASLQRRESFTVLSTPTTVKSKGIKKRKKHQQLIESFRDFLEELPDHHRQQQQQTQADDEIGNAITSLLNSDHRFRYQLACSGTDTTNNSGNDNAMQLRPLLSLRNWRRLQGFIYSIRHTLVHSNSLRDIPVVFKTFYRFLFWNVKPSIERFVVAFGGISILFLCGTTATVVVCSVWALKCTYLIGMLMLSILVDWEELSKLVPTPIRKAFSSFVHTASWADQILLFGKRYHGREWNKNEFELVHPANTAQSSQRGHFLWKMPPPTVKQIGPEHCTDPLILERKEWGRDTAEHVAAIDFCYLVLKEDFVQNQYDKLRKAVFKTSRDVDIDATSVKDEKIRHSRRKRCSTDESSLSILRNRSSSSDSMHEDLEEKILGEHRSATSNPDNAFSPRLDNILQSYEDEDESIEGDKNSTAGSLEKSACSGSDTGGDMNWMDVGAEIGIKLLGSAAVQKVMTSHDTADKISTFKDRVESHLAATKELEGMGREDSAVRSSFQEHERKDNENNELSPWTLPDRPNPISIPVHTMWTSASAAIVSAGSIETLDYQNLDLLDSRSDLKTFDEDSSNSLTHFRGIDINNRMPTGEDPENENNSSLEASGMPYRQINQATERRSSNVNKQSIEMICIGADSKQVIIKPNTSKTANPKRPLLLPGTKIVVPIFPIQAAHIRKWQQSSSFQMGTVVSSKRLCIYKKNQMPRSGARTTNCLSITVKLDKCFLRDGEFAVLTLRVMDEWGPHFMPRHSKLPLGSCISTSFGIGVLVGWRVEDDCHIVRCLWQRRGPGSACAYLRRDAIHSTVEAAVGFDVDTTVGRGTVVAYTNGGPDFRSGRYFVSIKDEGRHFRDVLELNRSDILVCESAQFIPIVEHIREAALYQLQLDFYREFLSEGDNEDLDDFDESKLMAKFSKHFVTIWKSFLRAIDEDDEFDEGMNAFIQSFITFLDQLDGPEKSESSHKRNLDTHVLISTTESSSMTSSKIPAPSRQAPLEKPDSGFWLMDNMFGIFRGEQFGDTPLNMENTNNSECIEVECGPRRELGFDQTYKQAFAVIRILMRTITIAQAASVDEPDFKLGLSICYEFLLFVKTIIKVQKKNMNPESLVVWRRAWDEIVSVFGPVKERLTRIGEGIAERMEKQGRRAKVRLLRFVDIVVQDEALLQAIEQGDWGRCAEQIEYALSRAKIIDESSREHYHKTGLFIYNHFASANAQSKGAAARNNEKVARFLMFIQMMAAPRKAILRLFLNDSFLDFLERILVRVFSNQGSASRMLTIHSSNIQSLRQLRMLKDFTIAGKFWIPLLDAADEEFSWAVSTLPDSAKDFLSPLSSLFSLCVVQFHKIYNGDLTKDWLDFLMEDEAIKIVHEIDMKLILALQSFSRDVKETMLVLPYYPSIDDDILNLVDELNIDEFVKEASEALEDDGLLRQFVKEKATIAIERFLDYIPKLSIPVEKRDLPEGWTLTCRASDGGHLRLKDLVIKRENLTCQVMGGDTIFFPMMEGDDSDVVGSFSSTNTSSPIGSKMTHGVVAESSILDDIREIILNAQRFGCWQVGIGGVKHPASDKRAAAALQGLPISSVLNCAIDLWRNLEIDDDELLEIAIRDVSYQIQLQKQRDENGGENIEKESKVDFSPSNHFRASPTFMDLAPNDMLEATIRRFNPRSDPTVLYLEIKKLTFNLENFQFRIEKHESKRTIFDPVFEGTGSVLVKNVSVKFRVECLKEFIGKAGQEVGVPILQLSELDVSIEKVHLRVQDTGADWLLNKIVDGFGDKFTEIMSANLCEQVRNQMDEALHNLNQYFASNPNVILGLLDISLDDLEERVVWV